MSSRSTMQPQLIGIVDIGKTTAKLLVIESGSGQLVHRVEHAHRSIERDGLRQLDVIALESWLTSCLREYSDASRIDALVPIAHGAAAVLLDAKKNVVCAPDYEDPIFDTAAREYTMARDAFAQTLSPLLPLGLNLGKQLFYLQTQRPDLFARVAHILTYPQYWAWRFGGRMATEITSLGCHTDLWLPRSSRFSALACDRQWDRLLAPLARANDVLGTVSESVSAATGLRHADAQGNDGCRIVCGIHDSNASYLGHALAATDKSEAKEALTVVSSGTWTILLSRDGQLDALSESRDMLANVDAFGSPVATARFMGGREYEAIVRDAASEKTTHESQLVALSRIVEQGAIALPCFSAVGGPFAGHPGRLINADALDANGRNALASLYLALMTDLLLSELLVSHLHGERDAASRQERIVIDGPLARNGLYATCLATLRPGARVFAADERTAACAAAYFLATGKVTATHNLEAIAPAHIAHLNEYRRTWRAQLPHQPTRLAS